MSEPMTVELIVEAEWRLKKNYWTKLRFPVGKIGDVDVLAYCPENKHLVVAEAKAQGTKSQVFAGAIGDVERDAYIGSLLKSACVCCKDCTVFQDFRKMVDRLTVQLVSNWVIDPSYRQEATSIVLNAVKKRVPITEVELKLDTTIEVFSRVIEEERCNHQTKRYGHPVLDTAREINRYLRPLVSGAGRRREDIERIRREAIRPLLSSLGLTEANQSLRSV